jgi:hypothetical protein
MDPAMVRATERDRESSLILRANVEITRIADGEDRMAGDRKQHKVA